MEEARKPEFSQCFGDKAALEELTDGKSNNKKHVPRCYITVWKIFNR